jgi:hypothetical protein
MHIDFAYVFGFLSLFFTRRKAVGCGCLMVVVVASRKERADGKRRLCGGCIATPTHTKHALNENCISLCFASCEVEQTWAGAPERFQE